MDWIPGRLERRERGGPPEIDQDAGQDQHSRGDEQPQGGGQFVRHVGGRDQRAEYGADGGHQAEPADRLGAGRSARRNPGVRRGGARLDLQIDREQKHEGQGVGDHAHVHEEVIGQLQAGTRLADPLKIISMITATLWVRMAATGAPVLGWRRPKAAGRKLSTPAANGRRAATPNQEL